MCEFDETMNVYANETILGSSRYFEIQCGWLRVYKSGSLFSFLFYQKPLQSSNQQIAIYRTLQDFEQSYFPFTIHRFEATSIFGNVMRKSINIVDNPYSVWDPEGHMIQIYLDEVDGLIVLIRQAHGHFDTFQGYDTVSFTVNEQRLVQIEARENTTTEDMCALLHEKRKQESPPRVQIIQPVTVHFLINFMRLRPGQPETYPKDEKDHWKFIDTPYSEAQGDRPKIDRGVFDMRRLGFDPPR